MGKFFGRSTVIGLKLLTVQSVDVFFRITRPSRLSPVPGKEEV